MRGKGIAGFMLFLVIASLSGAVFTAGCTGREVGESGYYCCRYESRHTGCGGKTWSSWEKLSENFDISTYKEGWTPEKVCNKYTGSTTRCDGGCCISVEYRNNRLSEGSCS